MLSASKGKEGQIGHLGRLKYLNIRRLQESTVKDVDKFDQKWIHSYTSLEEILTPTIVVGISYKFILFSICL